MAKSSHLTFRLTTQRVRLHGLLLAACLWTIYAADMATPGVRDRNGLIKGTDFLHFYTIGILGQTHQGELLYNISAQSELIAKLFPQFAGTVYVPLYPPQVSLFFMPFAWLPYPSALTAWLLFNAMIYFACCYAVWRTCSRLNGDFWTTLILAGAFPGFFHLIAWGQTSGLALLCFTLAYLALRKQHLFLAGLAIGNLIFKPQLGLAVAVVFVFSAEWRVIGGALAAAAAQLSIGWLYYGSSVMRAYVHAMAHIPDVMPLLEPRPYQMHSLRAFWTLLVPWSSVALGLYIATSLVALFVTVKCWRSQAPLAVRYSALLLATVLVAPHLTVYDLVILAPAFLLLLDTAKRAGVAVLTTIPGMIYLCYILFLIGPLSAFTHLQLSVLVLASLLWVCMRRGLPKQTFLRI